MFLGQIIVLVGLTFFELSVACELVDSSSIEFKLI